MTKVSSLLTGLFSQSLPLFWTIFKVFTKIQNFDKIWF